MTDEQHSLSEMDRADTRRTLRPTGIAPTAVPSVAAFLPTTRPTDVRIYIDARNKDDARQQALKRHKNLKDLN